MSEATARVRLAGRADASALVDLRMRYLGEVAHLEPRFALLPDARARTAQAMPVWLGQEERVLVVATAAAAEAEADAAGRRLVGYAMGLASVWPPVLRTQQVGEVLEVFVEPDARGGGLGRALLEVLTAVLVGRGARVLRAPVPARDAASLARFGALGYEPLQAVLQRSLEEL